MLRNAVRQAAGMDSPVGRALLPVEHAPDGQECPSYGCFSTAARLRQSWTGARGQELTGHTEFIDPRRLLTLTVLTIATNTQINLIGKDVRSRTTHSRGKWRRISCSGSRNLCPSSSAKREPTVGDGALPSCRFRSGRRALADAVPCCVAGCRRLQWHVTASARGLWQAAGVCLPVGRALLPVEHA